MLLHTIKIVYKRDYRFIAKSFYLFTYSCMTISWYLGHPYR